MAIRKKASTCENKPLREERQNAGSENKKRGGAKTAKMKERIEELERELSAARDAVLRARADMDNYRKRVQREMADAKIAAKCDALSSVLDVYDHFKMAVDAARTSDDLTILREGMEMIAREFDKAFGDAGVEVLDALGEQFNPDLHEAVGAEHSDEDEGVVIKQWRYGYKLGDRLLRPASVIVSNGPGQDLNKGDEGDA